MARYVALLRGVNVGKGNRVPMADFTQILEGLGCADVSTWLNSGNAVFSSRVKRPDAVAAQIRASLVSALSVDVPVIVKSSDDIADIIAGNVFAGDVDDPSRLLVAVAPSAEVLARVAELAPLAQPPDRLHIGTHAAYIWCPHGILDSPTAKALLGTRGRDLTTRNWSTMLKLRDRL